MKIRFSLIFAALMFSCYSNASELNEDKNLTKASSNATYPDIAEYPDVAEVLSHIEQNHLILICMRGLPGSGKSYLARTLVDRTMNGDYENHIFSTDDFFIDERTKQYNFNGSRLREFHALNQIRVAQRAMNGWSPIIVDNTNMKWWEMFNYFKAAVQYGYVIRILEPKTPWRFSADELAQRNSHGISAASIARMVSNYEPGTIEDILHAMQIHDYPMTPKLRSFPEIQSQQQQQQLKTN